LKKCIKTLAYQNKKNGTVSTLIINRAGIIEEPYNPDLNAYPAYFRQNIELYLLIKLLLHQMVWKTTIKYPYRKRKCDKDHDEHIEQN
jgi:hypothetical protein